MRHMVLSFFLSMSGLTLGVSLPADAEMPPDKNDPSAFAQMLAQVYAQHPQLQAARDELRMLDERVSQASAGFRPSLSANAAYGQQRIAADSQDWTYGPERNTSLTASQPLFNGFGTLAQWRAAKERVQAGRAKLLSTEQTVLLSAIGAWLDVCEKEKILTLNQEYRHSLQTYLDATNERYKAGDGTTTDVALAESRLAEAEAKLAMAEAARDIARADYERATGLMPQAADFPPLPAQLPDSREEAANAAHNNPDLAQADHAVEATDHDIDAASSSLWPSVSLRANTDNERSPTLGLEKFRNDSITLNVSIPLYQGGAEYSRLREARLAHEKSKEDEIDISRDVEQRAKTAWSNYSSSRKIIEASGKSVSAAGRALSGIEEEQKEGTRTLTEVLDAQDELLNAQISETQAEKDVRLEAYRLLSAIGNLTVQALHAPTTPYDPRIHYDEIAGSWAGFSSREALPVPQ